MSKQLPFHGQHLDDRLYQEFIPLCVSLPSDDIDKLKESISLHLNAVYKALRKNEFLDVVTASQIAETLIDLLDDFHRFPEDHQKLIVGGVRYFVQSIDVEPDTQSVIGFDDDLQVLNYVLRQIGRPEVKVEQ